MPRYKLAPGTQVREEDFGLLFYTMAGPRLYFLGSRDLLDASFFQGRQTLEAWLARNGSVEATRSQAEALTKGLARMIEKGVILEC